MTFHSIDMDNWKRKSHFAHYMSQGKSSYNITVNLDITALIARLKKKQIKFYPAFIYMVSRAVNAHQEFRTTFNEQGELGYWDEMMPLYTVFHKDDETFSALWSDYAVDFALFYQNYQADMKQFGSKKGLWVKKDMPANTFSVSSLPWMSFSSFELQIHDHEYLLPVITCGKHYLSGDKILLPLSLRVHHAVCDGYHASMFINDIQQLADSCEDWIR